MRKKIDHVNQSGDAGSAAAGPVDAGDVLEAVHRVMHRARALQHRGLAGQPQAPTPMEGRVLGFFARHPGATQSDLAQHSGRDKGQLARLIAGLRERGLLLATPDADDRRVTRLQLSPQAQQLHLGLMAARRRLSEQAAASLDAADRAQLLALLDKLERHLQTLLEATGATVATIDRQHPTEPTE